MPRFAHAVERRRRDRREANGAEVIARIVALKIIVENGQS
jgi:hypothetical protein